MNFYEALNLPPTATTEQIEEAYRKLARKVHPDLNHEERLPAEARMRLLNQIRDTLTDPKRRADYDAALAAGARDTQMETALDETLRDERSRLETRKRLWQTVAAGLLFGGLVGASLWYFLGSSPSPAPPDLVPPPSTTTPSASSPTPPVPTSKSAPAPSLRPKAGTKPDVVHFGSTTQEVLELMGKPDRVEELPKQGIRVLHYGKLKLVLKDGKLVPGSGVSRD